MTRQARQARQPKLQKPPIAAVPASTSGPFALSFSDAERAGQVLMWSPEGVGDFAYIAWVVAGLLGNGAGVRGLEVRISSADGSPHVDVSATNAEYVTAVAAGHGWRLYVPDDTYANAWGRVGEISVDVTWISPESLAHSANSANSAVSADSAVAGVVAS